MHDWAETFDRGMTPEVRGALRPDFCNRSTQHYAASDYFPQRRVMERITIVGDRLY